MQVSNAQMTTVAEWYANPSFSMLPVEAGLSEGNLVVVHPTPAQRSAGLTTPVVLRVKVSKASRNSRSYCYASYTLSGNLHYHPFQADESYPLVAADTDQFELTYAREIALATDALGLSFQGDNLVDINFIVWVWHNFEKMRRAAASGMGVAVGAEYYRVVSESLRGFAEFHDMIEFHSSGLQMNWTHENAFPAMIQ